MVFLGEYQGSTKPYRHALDFFTLAIKSVCVCEREKGRERERKKERQTEKQRERERMCERERDKERERE